MIRPPDPAPPAGTEPLPSPPEPPTAAAPAARPRLRRWVAALPALVATLLVIVAIAAAGVRAGGQTVMTPAAGTPEAAFATYVRHLTLGQTEAAWALLTPEAQRAVDWEVFREVASDSARDRTVRVAITSISETATRVQLTVTVIRVWSDPFREEWERRTIGVALRRIDGAWRIDTALAGLERW